MWSTVARYCSTNVRIKRKAGDYFDWICWTADGADCMEKKSVDRLRFHVALKHRTWLKNWLKERSTSLWESTNLKTIHDSGSTSSFNTAYTVLNICCWVTSIYFESEKKVAEAWGGRDTKMTCSFGIAETIFKVVGDVCRAKNLSVADQYVGSQLKEFQR